MCADDRSKQSSSAALIISIFSAVFTGGTAYYAYEQARYVQESIDLSRNLDLEPRLQARVAEINPAAGMGMGHGRFKIDDLDGRGATAVARG